MQSIPLAVLKPDTFSRCHNIVAYCMQSIPLAVFFLFFGAFFSNGRFFYGIMELSKKIFPGRDSDVCHLYDVGGNESD